MEQKTASTITTTIAWLTAAVAFLITALWIVGVWSIYSYYQIPLQKSAPMIFIPSLLFMLFGGVAAYLVWRRKTRVVAMIFFLLTAVLVLLLAVQNVSWLRTTIFSLIVLLLLACAGVLFLPEVKGLFIKKNDITPKEVSQKKSKQPKTRSRK